MLTDSQRDQLAPMLSDHVSGNFSGIAAVDLFGVEVVRKVGPGPHSFANALSFIRYAENDGTPSLLIKIVRTVDRSGLLGDLQRLVNRLVNNELVWGSVVGAQVLWMPVDRPFADRTELRSVVQSIATGTGPPSIAIQAPTGHGKKTMCSYIEACARQNSVVPVVRSLSKSGETCVVDFLVHGLRQSIPSSISVQARSPHRQARLLARDAAGRGVPTWFVVNLETSDQDDGVLEFVDELLKLVQADVAIARGLRITVLADDLPAIRLDNLPPAEDRFMLPEITCVELEEWFELAAPGRDKGDYARAAAMVLDQVDEWSPHPHKRLGYVAELCVAAHGHLMTVPSG